MTTFLIINTICYLFIFHTIKTSSGSHPWEPDEFDTKFEVIIINLIIFSASIPFTIWVIHDEYFSGDKPCT